MAGPGEGPAGLAQQKVDEGVAGRRLVIVVQVGHPGVGGPSFGDLRLQTHDLGLEAEAVLLARPLPGLGGFPRLHGVDEALGGSVQLLQPLGGHGGVAGQSVSGEGSRVRGLGAAGVGARQPVAEVKQLAHRRHPVPRGNGAGALVSGFVAQVLDHLGLGQQRRADQVAERRLVEARRKRVLERRLQAALMAVEPADERLQRQPRIEGRPPRIRPRQPLRPHREAVNLRELLAEESELRHQAGSSARTAERVSWPEKARCWREAKRVSRRVKSSDFPFVGAAARTFAIS